MYSALHDTYLIRHKSIEENFVTTIDHSQANIILADKVRRLSLQFGDAEDAAQPTRLRLLQVQSVAFFGLCKSLPSIAEFRLLWVMILNLWANQDNKSFDLTTVCQLFRLRYLEIVCNNHFGSANQDARSTTLRDTYNRF